MLQNQVYALEQEVLKVRHGFTPEEPDWAPRVENEIRQLREDGKWGDMESAAEAQRRREIRGRQKREWRVLDPGEAETFAFRGLLVDRGRKDYVHLRIKPVQPGGGDYVELPISILCGDKEERNTWTPELRVFLSWCSIRWLSIAPTWSKPRFVSRTRRRRRYACLTRSVERWFRRYWGLTVTRFEFSFSPACPRSDLPFSMFARSIVPPR